MRPREFYACIAVREFPAQAMLRLRPELRAEPCAVLDGMPPLETVCAINMRAQRIGIVKGMTRIEAETLPVTLLSRSQKEEQSARAALLACAARFTPRVEECKRINTYLAVLDIAGTGLLFGPPDRLAIRLIECLRSVGFAAAIAIAGSFHTALSLALARNSGFVVVPAGQERAALARLPLSVLDLTKQQADIFAGWGIRTLGELAALPEASLVARMGQDAKRLQRIALGSASHLFVPLEEELALEESIDLDTAVELLDSLLFVLRRLLEQLIARATHHLVTLAAVIITLRLEGGTEYRRTIRPALAGNELQLWMKLLQLDLAAHPPQAAIHSVTLTAETGCRNKVQLGLFSPQAPEPDRLDVTLARLRAIVGDDCVGTPVLHNTHRPDSFKVVPFQTSPSEIKIPPQSCENPSSRGALRMLRPAAPLTVTLRGNAPVRFSFCGTLYAIERAYGPWIASGAWWSPALWADQQWDVMARSAHGEMLYGCLAFAPLENCWKMVGLYD